MEGDRQQKAPALESRDTAYASNSRADRVQGRINFEFYIFYINLFNITEINFTNHLSF